MKIVQPPHWPKPKGYANAIAATGKTLFLAGQIGFDDTGAIVGDDFVAQAKQALRNVVTLVEAAGGKPEHIVRLTWFVTDRDAYLTSLNELGLAYREVLGRHYPAMSLLVVSALVEARAKVEIEATAVLPG